MSSDSPRSHQPRKRFGQHFLHDQVVIARIVAAIAPRPGDRLVEIGPGLGAMTCPLLEAAGRLDVVELDRDVIPRLIARCGSRGELQVHQADALRFDFRALRGGDERPPLRVVGNLPYNISTPLLFHLFNALPAISDMVFMLQKEVVDRLAAAPGSADYGRLSVMAQYHSAVEALFDVGPEAFDPPPRVDSAIVALRPYATPPVEAGSLATLERVVSQAFSQRRKTLRNVLRPLIDGETLDALGIDPQRRPETLALDEFARISRHVHAQPGEPA